jgi:TRAP-type C4-dicarboxylate transport system substrate-binding protein
MPLAYTLGVLTVEKRAFEKLETADQVLFRDTMRRAYARVDAQNRIDNVEARKALVANGLEMVTLSESEIDAWRAAAGQANDDLVARGVVSADILNQLLALVAEYRRGGQAQPSTISNSVE